MKKQPSANDARGRVPVAASPDPLAFLEQGVIDKTQLARARNIAHQQGVSVTQVLLSNGIVSPENYIRQLADYHGLTYLISPADLQGFEIAELKGRNGAGHTGSLEKSGLVNLNRGGQSYVAFDVLHYDEQTLKLFFDRQRLPGGRLLLITPQVKQYLLHQSLKTSRLYRAIHGLASMHNDLSARDKTSFKQKLVLTFLGGLALGGMALSPIATLYTLGGLLNLLFLCVIVLRLVAIVTFKPDTKSHMREAGEPTTGPYIERLSDEQLPVYTILVPLFREHRVVKQLIDNLLALDYPRNKLDIKLIFEQRDEATLHVAKACAPPPHFDFVIVPASSPQTKPKALNYALSEARGSYVVVYDAEDQPQTDQLRKAVAAFAHSEHISAACKGERGKKKPPQLACLQARLNHYNVNENWLARQFTIEYTVLFDGLLPALQWLDLPIPLGGTSNHFRIELLWRIGGWDAFNVTEDADLGIRLERYGYRCAMLASTTYEEACCRPWPWVRQRTRWLKGWLQTYLVHMRHPRLLLQQLGARGFAGFQIVLGAQVVSLLAHPVFALFMAYEAWQGHLFTPASSSFGTLFWVLALINFVVGYIVSIWLGYITLKRRGLRQLYKQLPLMPFYWLAMSFATFRALVHYITRPFHWEKTEHGCLTDDTKPDS